MLFLEPVDHGWRKGTSTVIVIAKDVIGGKFQTGIEEDVITFHGCICGPFGYVSSANHKGGLGYLTAHRLGPRGAGHGIHGIHKGMECSGIAAGLGMLIGPAVEGKSRRFRCDPNK